VAASIADLVGQLSEVGSTLVIGKTEAGKTVWLDHYLYANRDKFTYAWLFTKTRHSTDGIADRFHPAFVVEGWRPQVAQKIKSLLKQIRLRDPKIRSIICLDDVLGGSAGDKDMRFDNTLEEFFTTIRHYNAKLILLEQYNRMPPVMRTNIKEVVLFRQANKNLLEGIHKTWLSWTPFDTLASMFDTCTVDFHSFIIDLSGTDPKLFCWRANLAVRRKRYVIGKKVKQTWGEWGMDGVYYFSTRISDYWNGTDVAGKLEGDTNTVEIQRIRARTLEKEIKVIKRPRR
jgi:hypothetical protein